MIRLMVFAGLLLLMIGWPSNAVAAVPQRVAGGFLTGRSGVNSMPVSVDAGALQHELPGR
jgi:hypothetical protein